MDTPSAATIHLSPAQRRVAALTHPRWIVAGPPHSGVSTTLARRLHAALDEGLAPERVLALAPDRRIARRLAATLATHGAAEVGPLSYAAFAQGLIARHWPLAAAWLGIDAPEPVYLAFDLAQYACRDEYRRDPGALARITIREPRLIVQLLDNMNLAAANGLTQDETWRRVAAGVGLPFDDTLIQDGRRVTAAFRRRCIAAGVLPYDLQIETAAWLMGQSEVRDNIARRYDFLLVDGLDEFVPSIARAAGRLALDLPGAAIGASTDGGLRWMLGASERVARQVCRELVEVGGFRWIRLAAPDPAGLRSTASRIARSLADAGDLPDVQTKDAPPGWSLSEARRPDQMAKHAVQEVALLIADGVPADEIVLLSPYIDSVVASELVHAFANLDVPVPFRVERRWRSLLDDPATRACLTALRLVAPEPIRRASLVEVADLLAILLDVNAVAVQPLANVMLDAEEGALRPRPGVERRLAEARLPQLPEDAARLIDWVEASRYDESLESRLQRLTGVLLAQQPGENRERLLVACRRLARVAERFVESAPRLSVAPPFLDDFLVFIDSDTIAADDPLEEETPAVVLTTPYAFLTAGRTAAHQFWLDVASPQWWEPPLLLLTNPHALGADPADLPFTLDDDERVRVRVLARVIRNLAARAGVQIHTLASATGIDGEPLDGPLIHALRAAGVTASEP